MIRILFILLTVFNICAATVEPDSVNRSCNSIIESEVNGTYEVAFLPASENILIVDAVIQARRALREILPEARLVLNFRSIETLNIAIDIRTPDPKTFIHLYAKKDLRKLTQLQSERVAMTRSHPLEIIDGTPLLMINDCVVSMRAPDNIIRSLTPQGNKAWQEYLAGTNDPYRRKGISAIMINLVLAIAEAYDIQFIAGELGRTNLSTFSAAWRSTHNFSKSVLETPLGKVMDKNKHWVLAEKYSLYFPSDSTPAATVVYARVP